jgi:shikimate dehydrogenase
LFDVAYDPWPSPASKVWGDNSISGLELLIWQAIEQVKLFANSRGKAVEVHDQELYLAMKAAAATQTGLK